MAILGILSGFRSSRDLERLSKRHHQAFDAALGLELHKAACDSTFLYLFERVELEQLFGLLREWMLAQISDQDKDVDQLICDGKTLRGLPRSLMEPMAQRGLSARSRSMPGSWALRSPRPPLTPAKIMSAQTSKPCSAPLSSTSC